MSLIEELFVETTVEETRFAYVSSTTGELMNFPTVNRNCISLEEFKSIVEEVLQQYDYSVTSYLVNKDRIYLSILTIEDEYDWSCLLNYNDYGLITGEYSVIAEKEESNLPYLIGTKIQESIFRLLRGRIPKQDYEAGYVERRVVTRKTSDSFLTSISVVGLVAFLALVVIQEKVSDTFHTKAGDIQITQSYKELLGEDYKYVQKVLEGYGFENISVVKKNDLVTGILDGEHTVEMISINGKTKFGKGDWFDPTDEIIIEYHAYLLE